MNRIDHVDTTEKLGHVSLCAGYAGIDLGLRRAIPNLRTIAFSEIEAFACANLVSKMEAGLLDPAPVWTNLKTFPWAAFRDRVDVLSGGYPCQPFSQAGNRRGTEDPRHLWPFIRDGIEIMRPRVCFFENVEGHITLGLRDVLFDLAELGYRTTWGLFSAAEVGAPQQRKRVFILAVAESDRGGGDEDTQLRQLWAERLVQSSRDSGAYNAPAEEQVWPSRPREPQHGWEPPRVVGDAEKLLLNGSYHDAGKRQSPGQVPESGDPSGKGDLGDTEREGLEGRARIRRSEVAPSGRSAGSFGEAEPPLGGDAHGSARGMDYAELCRSGDSRVDELRLLGNGVVPATAERAFRSLMGELLVK